MLEPRHLAGVATALLGAFNNGYVLCVIAGAIPQLTAQFSLTASASSLVVSVLMLGALLGSLVGSFVCDVLGRRPCLALCGLAYASSALVSATASSVETIVFGRAGSGFAIGLTGVANPIYLTEVAPPDLRGTLVTVNELLLCLGCLAALAANLALHHVDGGWRWMLAPSLPAGLLQAACACQIAETPVFLAQQDALLLPADAARSDDAAHSSPYVCFPASKSEPVLTPPPVSPGVSRHLGLG